MVYYTITDPLQCQCTIDALFPCLVVAEPQFCSAGPAARHPLPIVNALNGEHAALMLFP